MTIRIALISGDGLPVSGLMTTFRNALSLGRELGVLEPDAVVPTDLGFSWRPDKPAFFPAGRSDMITPEWMRLCGWRPDKDIAADQLATDLTIIREGVAAFDELQSDARARLSERIDRIAEIYERHFSAWLRKHQPTWVIAMNMTLSDAVPATLALHRATEAFYAHRPGGVVFWDHDLFASCSVFDPATGLRMYPERPSDITPIPTKQPHTVWAVVSSSLAEEASSYPSDLVPAVVPNILPTIPAGLDGRHTTFRQQQQLDPRRPVLLNPVRVFHPKGVHLAVDVLASLRREARIRGMAAPYLLVFGSLYEDPGYARQVVDAVHRLGLEDDVRFLGGVPLSSCRDSVGQWHLDEIDLLRLAAASHGGVLFTPSVSDVETVGLGPGLAAAASIPCLTTIYRAFDRMYGNDFRFTRTTTEPAALERAAVDFLAVLQGAQSQDPDVMAALDSNRSRAMQVFPRDGWVQLWHSLDCSGARHRAHCR